MAYCLDVKIKYIYIYPLGGISKFAMDLNINWYKEFLILLWGPIFQYIAYLILVIIFHDLKTIIRIYHIGILLFNLLPIYPLDGGKLLALIVERFIPYKRSLKLVMNQSYWILIPIMILTPLKLNSLVLMILLSYLITKEKKKVNYIYEKFLLERYLKEYHFSKRKLIYKEDQFYREKSHQIKVGDSYYTEKEFLIKKYQKIPKSY